MNLYVKDNCNKITRDIFESVLDDPDCSKGSISQCGQGTCPFQGSSGSMMMEIWNQPWFRPLHRLESLPLSY
jgi:hypothetical protein